ncbi:hypothetical protein [Maribacter sp. 2210JD10-5]|uniref:hypothetical protein n=1 Tax=Maribacter sp. 2210JD10-5 TaxID=3386272 RepID=UPI0039BC605D
MILLKLIVGLILGSIAFQDIKERMVYWILFLLMGVFLGFMFLKHIHVQQYFIMVGLNILLVTMVLLTLFLYTKAIRKKGFINESFGLGDLLFFYAFALGFPPFTFILLFVGAILFSLITYIAFKRNSKMNTVPLAGFMGIFLIMVLLFSFLPNSPSLYLI